MNGPLVVAQAGASSSNSKGGDLQIIKITKPPAGQTEIFHASFNGHVKVDFTAIANEKITFFHDNTDQSLHIIFADGGQAIIEPFFDSMGVLSNMTVEVGPNKDLDGATFAAQFPITTDTSVLPAAGAGGNGNQASGADFHDPSVDPLAVPPPLPLLPPETLPPIVFQDVLPVVLTGTATVPPPTATGGSVATDEDHTVSGTVLFTNGIVVGGGGAFPSADGATVTLNANGTFTYDPTTASGFETIPASGSVLDSFIFTVADGGQTASGLETISVSVVDPPPTATAGSVATNEDHTVSGTLSFHAGETDDGGDGATLTQTGTVATTDGGVVTINANGTFTYDPTAVSSFETLPATSSVTDSFKFTVTDSHGQTASALETITISVLDSPPTATAGSVATNEDHTVSGTLSFAPGETDDGGDGATLTQTGTVATTDGGVVTLNANGTFTYDPTAVSSFETLPATSSVTDSFKFTVTDSHGQTASALETITVSVLDSPPTATAGSVATNEDHTVSGTLSFHAWRDRRWWRRRDVAEHRNNDLDHRWRRGNAQRQRHLHL